MKESYGKGVATHTGPESCAVVRKDEGEALTRNREVRRLPATDVADRIAKSNDARR